MVLMNENIVKIIKEELSKAEVASMIRDKVDSNLSSKDFEKKVKEIASEIMSEFFKLLWQRDSLWKNSIRR